MDSAGRPAKHCARCDQEMTHDDNGLPPVKPGICRMCGKSYRLPLSDKNACHC